MGAGVPDQGHSRPPSLAGRQRELSLLWKQFERAVGGHSSVALVTGESGIGKTRLLNEIAVRATEAGSTVLRGGASDAEGMPPYLPFLEALGSYVRTAPQELLVAQIAPVAHTLVNILPELVTRLQDLPARPPLPTEQARLRLFEAVGSFLAAIAATRPVLLVLDDLQWTDPASLDLLVHVAAHQDAARLLILSAYRDDDVEHRAGLAKATQELHRRRLLTTVALGPLSVGEVGELAVRQLGGSVDPAIGARLHAQSDGNPFFAEEVLREWVDRGALARAGGSWSMDGDHQETLPAGIAGVIRQRLVRLPPETVAHLRTAAVVGRTFDLPLLSAVTGHGLAALEDAMLGAAEARLVASDGQDVFSFCHDKTRECLYSEVSSTRRKRLHEAIGGVLEAGPDQASPQRLAALAFHFARSGDAARGAQYSRRAAQQALSTYAPAEGAAHLRTALNLLGREADDRGELLLELGEAALLAGDEPAAIMAYEEAQTWYEQAGASVGGARATHALLLMSRRLRALPSARAEIDAAMRLMERNQAARDASLGRVYAWRANQYALMGEWRQVRRLIAAARPVVERVAGPQQLAFLHQLRGLVAYQRGSHDEAVREYETALSLSQRSEPDAIDWRPGLLGLLGLLALAQKAAGQERQATASLTRLDVISATRAPAGWPQGGALTCLALGWITLGDRERAEAHYAALLPMQGELHWFLVDRVLGLVDIARGDWDAATAHLSMASATARHEGLRPELGCSLVALAQLELARGKKGSATRAEDFLHEALVLFRDLGMAGAEGKALSHIHAVQRLAPRLPGGLTSREVSVVRLVAAGRSNRDIAQELALSEKTVANHLTSVFSKLGVDNRAAAAAFGVRNGLI